VSSVQHCYWFAMPIFPTGPSYTRSYSPIRAPLGIVHIVATLYFYIDVRFHQGLFSHNSAHGCWANGLHCDDTTDFFGNTDLSDNNTYLTLPSTLNAAGTQTNTSVILHLHIDELDVGQARRTRRTRS